MQHSAEMAKLAPYEAGLGPEAQHELRWQRRKIARLRREAPPPQWEFPALPRKIGRNERCYCGSGKKFKPLPWDAPLPHMGIARG
jgi:uncharacterized protein YchJ